MAHDDNFMPRDISAAEIYYKILHYTKLAHSATSDKEKTAFLEEKRKLYRAITVTNVIFSFYDNGKVESEEWHNDAGEVSRADGPAVVYYEINGLSKLEGWYIDGNEHRLDGPAMITYYTREDNIALHAIKQETWFFNGKVHRGDDEPAFCGYFEGGSINVKRWFVRGQLHRVDGPAIVVYYDNGKVSYQAWYQHGEIHHDDGPAFVKYDVFGEVAEKTWYNHGVPLS